MINHYLRSCICIQMIIFLYQDPKNPWSKEINVFICYCNLMLFANCFSCFCTLLILTLSMLLLYFDSSHFPRARSCQIVFSFSLSSSLFSKKNKVKKLEVQLKLLALIKYKFRISNFTIIILSSQINYIANNFFLLNMFKNLKCLCQRKKGVTKKSEIRLATVSIIYSL